MFFRDVVTDAAQLRRATFLATAILASTPLVAAAAPRHDRTSARIAAAAGVVYGGVTPQGYGLMVEVNKSRRQIVRMHTGLQLSCTSGAGFAVPDNWVRLRISRNGGFSASFGPSVRRNDDGTSVDAEGTIRGKFNSSRTSVSGRWTLKLTARDATGAVTDTCDSGIVNWKARQ